MTRYSRYPFDVPDALCGNPLTAPHPVRDRALPHSQELPELHLSAGNSDSPFQSVKSKHGHVYITPGNHLSTAQSDNRDGQTKPVPKQAKTGDLWERFLSAIGDLNHPKSTDQTVVGRAIGVGQSMVSEIKRGEKNPSLDVAVRMAEYAHLCVEYLLTAKGPMRPWAEVDTEFKKLMQLWEGLDDNYRRSLLEAAEAYYAKQGRPRRPKIPQVDDTNVRLRKRSDH